MQLALTAEDEKFRHEVRSFLAAELPRDIAEAKSVGIGVSKELTKRWYRILHDKGWVAPAWPAQFGGTGWTLTQRHIWQEEAASAGAPPLPPFGLSMVGPVIYTFGNEAQKAQHLPGILSGDTWWCQGYSEPGSGSDLASLKTRAVRDGDDYIVNGQKIWTSNAQFSEYGFMLARTDPDVVKQAGITAFLVPMDAAGVMIRPIRQMSGPASFNEVFFDGVRIPDALRIGEVNDGWKVAMATLGFERSSSGSGHRRKGGTSADLVELAGALGLSNDPVVRQRLADIYVRTQLHAATVERVARATATGENPGPAGSLGKLLASDNLVRIGNVASELLGSAMVADTGEWGQFAWSEHVLGAPGYRLAGGTDEVQRNIIAERVLGLPAEQRADKAPFSQLSKS